MKSPGICHVPEKAGLSFSCVGGQLQDARLSAALAGDPFIACSIPLECKYSLSLGSEVFIA